MSNLTREECEQALEKLYDEAATEYDVDEDDGDLICADCTNEDKYLDMREPLDQLIKEHFDNPPLKFNELEEGMWVWDDSEYEKNYALIKRISICSDGDRCVLMKQDENDCDCISRIFDENRFYRREVTKNETN